MSLSKTAKILILFTVFYLNWHFVGMRQLTITYDEWPHLRYGLQTLQGDTNRFDDSKMPVSALNALPLKVAAFFGHPLDKPVRETLLSSVRAARYATVLTALALGFLVFLWGRSLYGTIGAFLSLFLFAFEPNLTAHAQLVTTDLYAAFGATLALAAYWYYTRSARWPRALVAGLALGLAQLAKYSCVYLYPIFALIGLIRWAAGGFGRAAFLRGVRHAAIMALVSICVINAGFLFNRSFTPLSDYNFKSDLFVSVTQKLPVLSRVPVPLPYPFVEGLDLVKYGEETGTGFGKTYLFGQIREAGDRFGGYYVWVYLLKTPIALQILILAALILSLTRFRKSFLDREIFLIFPAFFYFIYFNFFCGGQMGIRYLLVFYPLLFVLCGGLLAAGSWPVPRKVFIILLSYYAVSSASYFPHQLSYFNEILSDRKDAYRYLADSNLDWGQSVEFLRRDLAYHPGSHYNPKSPVAGRVVVDANFLVGVRGDSEQYRWLRDNFEPTGHVAYAYLVYDVTPDKLAYIMSP